MLVAILSDIHDNLWQLRKVLDDLRRHDPGAVLYCGDFCAPFTLRELAEGCSCAVYAVFGNNDGDRALLTRTAGEVGNLTLYGELAGLELDGLRVAINHYPEIAGALLLSGQYDLVCTGHSHRWEERRQDQRVLVNPGEVLGRFGESTYAVFDTATRGVRRRAFPWNPA
jgi:putative phosphoesterase